jgi:hypothetical protein
MTRGDDITEYNGVLIHIKNIPDAAVRHMLGYGHHNPYNRPVVQLEGRTWPFTPDTCEVADEPDHTEWIENGTTLVCTGCGLDGT